MDTFSACVAFGPLAIYLLLLGIINLAGRPLVVGGTREMLALGLALLGFVVVGPMQLFLPQEASAKFGWIVWLLLGSFYGLCLTLVIMLSRPRLVVYNVSLDELREVLAEVAARLDHESRWAGRAVVMPQMRVNLQIETYPPLRNTSLVAVGGAQSVAGWQRLEASLRGTLAALPSRPQSRGAWLILCSLAILAALALSVADNPHTIALGLDRMLHP